MNPLARQSKSKVTRHDRCAASHFLGEFSALNPCPWDYYEDTLKPLSCASALVAEYQKRICGALLDLIDTRQLFEVPGVDDEKLSGDRLGNFHCQFVARSDLGGNSF